MSDQEEKDDQRHDVAATREEPADEFGTPPSKDESEANESEAPSKAP